MNSRTRNYKRKRYGKGGGNLASASSILMVSASFKGEGWFLVTSIKMTSQPLLSNLYSFKVAAERRDMGEWEAWRLPAEAFKQNRRSEETRLYLSECQTALMIMNRWPYDLSSKPGPFREQHNLTIVLGLWGKLPPK